MREAHKGKKKATPRNHDACFVVSCQKKEKRNKNKFNFNIEELGI